MLFYLQSSSKPFTYAVCLNELGSEDVHKVKKEKIQI